MSARDRSDGKLLVWYSGGLLAAVAVGWAAASLHAAGVAPLVILPVALGIALGAILGGLAAYQRIADKRSLVIGAVLLALVAVVAQHAWLYRDFRRQWHEARANSPEVAMFRPESPWSPREYFGREMTLPRVALWILDGALITTAAAGTILVIQRQRR